MSAKLLLGKPVADAIRERVTSAVNGCNAKLYAIGMRGSDAWEQYSHTLCKSAAQYGVACEEILVEENISPERFCKIVERTSKRKDAVGVIVQQPLPVRYADAVNFIDVAKDVDCLNPLSVARLYKGEEGLRPATPSAVLALLDFYGIDLVGKRVVIVGRGNAVGKPLALMALSCNATVTVCHTKTKDLPAVCRSADVLISACGVAGLITSDFVTDSTVVIDVGLSFVEGKTCGDVSSEVYEIAAAVSPVPGGVGPVTRAALFENLSRALSLTK